MTVTDLRDDGTDAVIMTGGDDDVSVRAVVRPSGTEPKVKSYIEIRCSPDVAAARERARSVQDEVAAVCARF